MAYKSIGQQNTFRKKNASWFPAAPRKEQGVFTFHPISTPPIISTFNNIFQLSFGSLYRRIVPGHEFSPNNIYTTITREGSIVLPQLFRQLKEDFNGAHPSRILSLIYQEFDIYEYHYEPRNRPRLSQLRSIQHSLVQQLIRQDPGYYTYYVFLQPNHAQRLISFPYYTTYALPSENTFFIHIDTNVRDLIASGRGKDILQGSVSLNDEDESNYTIILPGIHHHIITQQKDLVDRSPDDPTHNDRIRDGLVQRVTQKIQTKEDAARYNTNWKTQVYQAGDVRLSLPTLPHSSTGPATIERRTVLP